jgi:dolichol-phosphate mannosyltransferase
MTVLALLAGAGMAYLPAGALAVETAIATNFLLHELWSFADLVHRRSGAIPRVLRFLKFNLFCAGGAGIALIILWFLTEYGGVPYLLSNFVGIIVATAWNYGMNANLTWDTARAERTQL